MEATTRPRRQEQEPASAEITEVAPSVLRMQLPIQMPGLGHVNCYALVDSRGAALVDPGLPGEESWNALVGRLAAAEIPLARVHTVVVTHSHPDHFGGAARLRAETGAEIITHRAFRMWWNAAEPDGEDPEAVANTAGRPVHRVTRPWDGDEFKPPDGDVSRAIQSLFGTPTPTKRLDDADVVKLAGRDWVAVHTPGHTPDHLCLYDPVEGLMLSGDHVLPSITPHISGIGNADDPLAEYFASLELMGTFEGITQALPAHGHPFVDLAGRAADIRQHHEERLDILRAASADIGRPASVEELMQRLFSERAWGQMAASETYAHLEHLRLCGAAETRRDGDILLYDIVA